MAFQPQSGDPRNHPAISSELQSGDAAPAPGLGTPEYWMRLYQQADPAAPGALIAMVSPALLRFFRFNAASREQAEDLLQETWLKIHRMRHTWRPGERVLPWVYAIAHHVRIDSYRRTRRQAARETALDPALDPPGPNAAYESIQFESLVAALPDGQREVITMLKAAGMTVEEVARATSSTVGAVKLKAHRAYERLRELLQAPSRVHRKEGAE
ncbi:MAG: RNA polymerase sigma factor [Bryobacteraceae bacterium]|jgi:RNA polymerase sigma-70 factor, ECF subfamily